MIPTKLIALVIVTFALAGLMVPAGVLSNTAFAQSADEIIENVESLVSDEITALLDEDDDDGNGEEEAEAEEEEEEGDDGGASREDSQNLEQAIDQEQENEQNIEQSADETNEDNINEVDQDSSADDNIQVNENEFGDDIQVAVPISDQDQTAENRAINLDLEEEEVVVEEPDDGVPPPPPGEEGPFFCSPSPFQVLQCFESEAECEQAAVGGECQRFETFPEGAFLCTRQGEGIDCQL